MEYVPGAVLETRSPSTPDNDWLKQDCATTTSSTLRACGRLIALDMVINNLDRIRTVRSWPESNPGNVFISCGSRSEDGGSTTTTTTTTIITSTTASTTTNSGRTAVAIDSAASWGSYSGGEGANEASFEKRIENLTRLLSEVVGAPNTPHKAFENVRTLLKTGLSETVIGSKMWMDESMKTTVNEYHEDKATGVMYKIEVELEKKNEVAEVAGWPGLGIDVGDAGVLEVQHGFVECVKRLMELPPNAFAEERDAVEQVIRTEKIVDKNQWMEIVAVMIKEVDVDGTLSKGMSEWIQWIATTSTSAIDCNACAPERCRRVVDAWRGVLDGGGGGGGGE